jgi:hypothetical protein
MKRIVLHILLLFVIASPAMAQTACELTLTKAQEEFDAGRFHGVPGLLKDCLGKHQNREWEQRAYLLLAETYLLLEDPAKADESYLKVLQANPEFLTDETRDPIDLVYLSKKFTATPLISVSGKFGLNTAFMRVIHDVTMPSAFTEEIEQKYDLNIGWQATLGIDYNYTSRIAFGAEAMMAFTSFTYNSKGVFEEGNYSLEFTDKQTWIAVPLVAKYTHGDKPLRPFASFGYSPSFLVRDRADIVIDGDRESEVYDYKYKRNSFNHSVFASIGLKYKWGLRYIFGELRYSAGLKNLTNPATRYDHYDGINQQWPYVDDDFRMDNLYLSIGYVHPFYKARKLKKAKTKSVLRKTKRSDASDN